VVCGERSRIGPAVQRLEDRGLHLLEAPGVEELPGGLDHPGPLFEDLAGVRVHDEVQIARAVPRLYVL